MRCHYEILEVSRDADIAEIKTAYRKFALKWHPDKNLNNNVEFAKEQFQLVQQAYEVLSDPQERAWYDKHREQILKGANSDFQDNSLDVFPFFTTTCFKGYNDDEKGFYTVYRNVFNQIIEEDLEFMEDKDEFDEIPRFGDSKSDYDEVVGPFYAYWSCYSTKKTYVWLDPVNISEIRHRKTAKHVEKENKKIRMQAKKERNEEIRNLVAFVRKRDKRMQEHVKTMEAKVLENRQKHQDLANKKRLERKKELFETSVEAEWSKFDNVQSELEQIEKNLAQEFGDDFSNSEDECEVNDLYCVACNKIFKTAKALENHESSKKHKENVERLKEEMLDDEEIDDCDDVEEEEEEEIESDVSTEKVKKKKKNKKKNVLTVEETNGVEHKEITNFNDSDVDFEEEASKKQKKRSKKQSKEKVIEEKSEESEAPQTNKKKRQNKKGNKNSEEVEIDITHCCVTCKANFPSKNKLFDHLKKTGHGVYLPNKNKNKVK